MFRISVRSKDLFSGEPLPISKLKKGCLNWQVKRPLLHSSVNMQLVMSSRTLKSELSDSGYSPFHLLFEVLIVFSITKA